LAAWITEQYGIQRSPAHLCRLFKRVGLSYKRTSHSLRHKQDLAAVVERQADLETLEKGG
jgi:transposase